MQRLFVHEPLFTSARIVLDKAQSNYVVNVLRLRENDKLKCFNGNDGEWEMHLSHAHAKQAELTATACLREQQPCHTLALVCCPIKKGRMEYMIEKATELGVTDIFPVLSARTIVKPKSLEKWQHYCVEAAEQCERLDIPTIHPVTSLRDWCHATSQQWQPVFADENGSGVAAAEYTAHSTLPPALIIGPEGGFDSEEADMLRGLDNSQIIHLGPLILRADTAAIAGLALLQSKRDSWQQQPRFEQP